MTRTQILVAIFGLIVGFAGTMALLAPSGQLPARSWRAWRRTPLRLESPRPTPFQHPRAGSHLFCGPRPVPHSLTAIARFSRMVDDRERREKCKKSLRRKHFSQPRRVVGPPWPKKGMRSRSARAPLASVRCAKSGRRSATPPKLSARPDATSAGGNLPNATAAPNAWCARASPRAS